MTPIAKYFDPRTCQGGARSAECGAGSDRTSTRTATGSPAPEEETVFEEGNCIERLNERKAYQGRLTRWECACVAFAAGWLAATILWLVLITHHWLPIN